MPARSESGTHSGERRNLLFIVLDQWRAEVLGASETDRTRAPNLDRLVSGGTLFRYHFTQATP